MHGLKELLQDCNSGRGQATGALKAQLTGKSLEIPAQDGNCVGKTRKPRVAADFADDAQDADGAELFEDVGVTEDGGLDRLRLIAGLVLTEWPRAREEFCPPGSPPGAE